MAQKIEQDVKRFRDIIRGRIKKELRKFITNTELIGKKGKNLVSIPIPQIDIPHFVYGDKQRGGVGQGDGEIGQSIGAGEGKEGSAKAGNMPGEHLLEVEISFQELAEILGEELELPKIKPKGDEDTVSKRVRYTSIGLSGPESLKHFKRTYRQALKRQIMSGTYDPKKPIIIPVREDRRYRMWKEERKPEIKAVIIYMMDVSGCHTRGHFVEMADGSYKDISEIAVGDKVACVDVSQRKKTKSQVSEIFKYKVGETVNIHTEDHLSLRITPNHKYFIYDEINDVILEKEAKDIKTGDFLVLVNQFGKSAETNLTKHFTETEAYLFGAMLGDGHVTIHIDKDDSQKNSRFVMITDENEERLSYYADCAHTAFGIKGIIKDISSRKRLFLNSVDLVKRIEREMPSLVKKSRQRYIEPIIFRQPPKVRAAFLRGLFDAEGTIAAHAVEMLSSSLPMVKQVKLLLSYFGIRARISQYDQEEREINGNKIKAGTFYRLVINSKDAILFGKEIGFGCKEKNNKLTSITERQGNGIDAMRSRFIPSTDFKALNEAFLICSVKETNKCADEIEVYDFTVDKHNNYIVDGVLSHNSMGSEQKEIVRLEAFWIDTWIKSQYKDLEVRYIIHDAVAREVDRETFFHTRESGGTIISSAYKLCLKMIEEKYSPAVWNIYPFHFSDGDNWSGNDTDECIKLLKEHLLPAANIFCYGQVESEYGSGQFLKDLTEHLPDAENLITSKIENKDAIVKSIKDFLGKGK